MERQSRGLFGAGTPGAVSPASPFALAPPRTRPALSGSLSRGVSRVRQQRLSPPVVNTVAAAQSASYPPVDLPIYAEAVGPLKAIGYVEEGRLDAQQIARVRAMGNETDGKYVWNPNTLSRLLRANAHVFGPDNGAESAQTVVRDFVRRVTDRARPIDDRALLCLVHVAFLDPPEYAAGGCAGTFVVVPDDIRKLMDDVLTYGSHLTPEEAWVVALSAPPQNWSRLLAAFDSLKAQVERWRDMYWQCQRQSQS